MKLNGWIASGAVVILLGGMGAVWYINANRAPSFPTYTVGRGNVVSSVDIPVSVFSENSVALSFQESGEIVAVPVSEGQTVAAGTTLASLDTSSLQAGVDEAQAALAAAQAKLDELQTGTRPEQIAIDESAVVAAQTSLGAAVASAYSAADDAVRNQTDNFFMNPDSNSPLFNVTISDSQLVTNIEADRLTVGGSLNAWYLALAASSTDPATLSGIADQALARVQSYLDLVALAVNNAVPNALPVAVLEAYKTDIVTARNEVNGAATALAAAETDSTGAQSALSLAEAGSTHQDIEAQQAAVLQAQATLASADVALRNAALIAPFPGTIYDLTAQVGQVVSPGVTIVSLTNNAGLKIEGYVPETQVANVKSGDVAIVTLDAYGGGITFPATVTTVDSAETMVNGTPAYQVTLHFANPDNRLKDGMTGSVHIVTAEHDDVIEVPTNLIITNDNQGYILVKRGMGTSKIPVTTGIAGDNGMTEIISGVNAGDEIINL